MEINSHSQLLISLSPSLIKTRKLFLELAGMRKLCLIPQSLPHSLLASVVVFCTFVVTCWCVFLHPPVSILQFVQWLLCSLVCMLRLLVCLHLLSVFSSLWQYRSVSITLSLSLSICPCTCVSVRCVGSHVVDLGLKLWVITPIMNHHALFRLSSPTGIDCIMKLSFSLSNTLCPHITHLTNTALHMQSDNESIYIAWQWTSSFRWEVALENFGNLKSFVSGISLGSA